MKCHDCGKEISDEEVSLGMNLPPITDGPQYWCHDCKPVQSAEEVIAQFYSFFNPPKEQ